VQEDWTLRMAAALAAVETTVLIVAVLIQGGVRAPLVVAALAVKYPFCLLAVRRGPGAFMGLLLWEVGGACAALAGKGWPTELRVIELLVALTVIAFLIHSFRLFPPVELPPRPEP